jgi:16S rRNA (guanine527-N7)-methyltransferase
MAPSLDLDLSADRARALALVDVSRETLARLDRFVELLLAWQSKTNLIAPSTIPSLWVRHIADSLQLIGLAPEGAKVWADLGTGGGFPGLVIACALAEVPGACVHLIESNAKKAAFLREAVRETGAAAEVHAGRIETTQLRGIDVVTARALAPLNRLFTLLEPLLKKGAQTLLPKGQDVDAELTEATKYWRFDGDLVPSKTSATGRILVIRRLARRGDRGPGNARGKWVRPPRCRNK